MGVGEVGEFVVGSTKGDCMFYGAIKYEGNLRWTGAIIKVPFG